MLIPDMLTLGLLAVSAQSADAMPADAGATDDLVVIAPTLPDGESDTAYGQYDLPQSVLSAVPRQSFEELLAQIPGAQQFRRADSRSTNPTAQGLTLRAIGGNAAARTLLLRDGVPLADPFFGSLPFNAVLLAETARVSITTGAGAGPFGGGAIAGVIELESVDAAERPATRASLGVGSFDTLSAAFGTGARLGSGALRLAAQGERSDGFWTTPLAQRVPASVRAAYRNLAGEVTATALQPAGRLDLRLSAFDDRRTLRFAGADSRSQGVDVSARWVSTGAGIGGIEAVGWIQLRDFAATTISATSFRPVLDQRATPSLGWGGKLEVRPAWGGLGALRVGLDVRGAEGRTDEVALAASGAITLRRRAGGRSLLAGAYAEHDVRIGPLLLGTGIRVDRWWLSDGHLRESTAAGAIVTQQAFADRSVTRATARSALAWDVGSGLMMRAAAYRGFRVPTLNELFRPFVLFPVTTNANAALAPERLTGVEGGLTFAGGEQAGGSITLFRNRVAGGIANVTVGPNLRQRANLPGIDAHGVEAVGWARLAALGELRLVGAWTDARVRGGDVAPALTGLRPAQTPRLSGSATLQVNGPGALRSVVMLRHGGRQFEDDRNLDVLPAYTSVDAAVRMPLGNAWSLDLSVENLGNARILTRNSGGSIDLGAPRQIRLTLRTGLDLAR